MKGIVITNTCNVPGAKMATPIPDYLKLVLDYASQDNPGTTAQYIPELANADPEKCALCLSTIDGFVYGVGDIEHEFSIQSISKAFVYALALEEHGVEYVVKRVGVEPSGEAFNELSLEDDTCRPLNPMINAGAITTHSLVGPRTTSNEARFDLVLKGLSAFAGRDLSVDEQVYQSEMATAFRNISIANMLRNYNVIEGDPMDVVKGYVRQCAVKVTCRDLALMAATLANGGIQPVTGERVVRPAVVRQVLSVLMTCGMYDGAGDWMTSIGLPAKSGVAGGLLAALPGQVGLATFSPRLDKHGSSVRGVRMCKRLSDDMGLHIMSAPEPAHTVVRRHYLLRAPDEGGNSIDERRMAGVISLQGTIQFTSAERVLRVLSMRSALTDVKLFAVVLDIRSVWSIEPVARRMIREAIVRLRHAGFRVTVVDPKRILGMIPSCDNPNDVSCTVDDVTDDLRTYDGWERLGTPTDMRPPVPHRAHSTSLLTDMNHMDLQRLPADLIEPKTHDLLSQPVVQQA